HYRGERVMQEHTHRERVMHRLLMSLLAAGACFAVAAQSASPSDSQPSPSEPTESEPGASLPQQLAGESAAVTSGASGIMVHIDPQTGAILKEPAPGTVSLRLTSQLRNALSTSHQGLIEVPSAAPGGGVKVDLQGRFQSPLLATIDANGQLKMQH